MSIILFILYYAVLRSDSMSTTVSGDWAEDEAWKYSYMQDDGDDTSSSALREPPVFTTEMRHRRNITYSLKILLGFMQIAFNLTFLNAVPWPRNYQKFMDLFNFININLVPWQSVGCVTPFDFYYKLIILCLSPIIVFIVISFLFLVPLYLIDSRDKFLDDDSHKKHRQKLRFQYYKLCLFTLFLIYPGLSSSIFSFYHCMSVQGRYYLVADFSLRCGVARWWKYFPVALVATLAYPVGVPAAFGAILYRNRNVLHTPEIREAIGFLYAAYHNTKWWFELCDMFHKLALTALLRFLPPLGQMAAAMLIVCIYYLVIMLETPYIRKLDDLLHLTAQTELFMIMLGGHFLITSQRYGLDELTDLAMSIVMITIILVLIAFFVVRTVVLLKHLWHAHQSYKMKKLSQKQLLEEAEDLQADQAQADAEDFDPNVSNWESREVENWDTEELDAEVQNYAFPEADLQLDGRWGSAASSPHPAEDDFAPRTARAQSIRAPSETAGDDLGDTADYQ